MEELIFITKKAHRAETDVSINTTYSKDRKNNSVSIIFRHDVETLITMKKSEYIIVALLGERIYFRYATQDEGYKLSDRGGKKHNRYTSITESSSPAFFSFVEKHTGDYPLKYDKDRNLHYIECD